MRRNEVQWDGAGILIIIKDVSFSVHSIYNEVRLFLVRSPKQGDLSPSVNLYNENEKQPVNHDSSSYPPAHCYFRPLPNAYRSTRLFAWSSNWLGFNTAGSFLSTGLQNRPPVVALFTFTPVPDLP